MYHIIYRTHNLINGKEYTGKHSTNNLNDGYYGSGKLLDSSIKKYGLENFAVEILSYHDSKDGAFLEESKIVNEEYVERDDTYNLLVGGDGGWDFINQNNLKNTKGMTTVKDKNGQILHVSNTDIRFINGELVGVMKEKITVKDKDGNTMSVSVNDPRYLSGELIHHTCGLVSVKDKDGNTMSVSVNDPRYKSRDLVGVSKGTTFKMSKQSQSICPHCGKSGRSSNIKRWHFDNCKLLTIN